MSNIHSAATCGNRPPLDRQNRGAEQDGQGSSLKIIAAEIEAQHQATYRAARAAIEHAMRCGELLLDAKTKVGHGEWLPWLEANTSIGIRQAQNYMRIAKNRLKIEAANTQRDSHLPVREAVTLLAEPKPPRQIWADEINAKWHEAQQVRAEMVDHLKEARQHFDNDEAFAARLKEHLEIADASFLIDLLDRDDGDAWDDALIAALERAVEVVQ